MSVVLYPGDNITSIAGLADNSVDSVVTDPPYGLSQHASEDVTAALLAWAQGREYTVKKRGGFMGKTWDSFVPGPEIWKEVFRVLKPGGHILCFAGSRTDDLMGIALRLSGFEIRDKVMWLYGNGLPKSYNLAGDWQGWGTALKPAFEPIIVARKPLAGTVVANVLAHGTGALNIDACRVGDEDGGRWPANVIHDGSEQVEAAFAAYGERPGQIARARNDGEPTGNNVFGAMRNVTTNPEPRQDAGTASRFFYSAKASKADRADSKHPTVKPLALMRYLCRLVTPPGGTVLDPFAGSGTTGAAAVQEGFNVILMEREPEYQRDIARRFDGDILAEFSVAEITEAA